MRAHQMDESTDHEGPVSNAPSSWPFRTMAVGTDGSVDAFQPQAAPSVASSLRRRLARDTTAGCNYRTLMFKESAP